MNNNILIYQILFKLYNLGVESFSVDDLHNIYTNLSYIINGYGDKNLAKLTFDENIFVDRFVFVFTYFELGLFVNKELIYNEPIFIESIINHYTKELKLSAELSHHMYNLLLENKNLKK